MKKKLLTFFATHERTFNFVKVILWIFVFFIWFNVFRLPLDSAPENFVILIVLLWIAGFLALLFYLLPQLNDFINIKINEVKQKMREEFLGSVDIADMCMEMLEEVQKKHRYTNYESKLENLSDWMAFQIKNDRHKRLSEVAEGMNPNVLDEAVKNSVFGNHFEGQRGAYDTPTEDEKDLAKTVVVTFDNVFIAPTKFLDWLQNHNWFVINFFGSGAFIEVNVLTEINLLKNVFNHLEIRVKINTKAMSKRGKGEIVEIVYNLDEEQKPTFREIYMMHTPLFSYTEKDMDDSDTEEIILFMRQFIKNNRKLTR